MSFGKGNLGRWLTRVLVLTLLVLPATSGGRVLAQDDTIIGEWEITFEVVNGKIKATWIGRVWHNEEGVETLTAQRREDISADCATVGAPLFADGHVTLDGVDDYITCEIPDFPVLFGEMEPKLANCRCRYEGPPYAAADVSPVLTSVAQPVVFHERLHLEVMQQDAVADLELAQGISTITPEIGDQIAFSVTVINHGPAAATGVRVDDQLPAGYAYTGDHGSGDYNSETGIWTIGTLAVGASATLHLSATINAAGDYSNVAQVATSNEADPDSTPGNYPADEDDSATASMNPNFTKVRFPIVMTGPIEEQGVLASAAASDSYGQTQLTLHFNDGTIESLQSNVFAAAQPNGFQVWAGYNASRYVDINDPDGFGKFLSADGFWDAVEAGDFVEGFFMWESEAQQKYLDEPMPAGFGLGPGTFIYIGHNPETNAYFDGTLRGVSVDPGCRGH